MEKEKHVCALKYAKELKELGYPQDSLFYWVKWIEAMDTGKSGEDRFEDCGFHWNIETRESAEGGGAKLEEFEYYAAPTVAELGEVLPNDFMSYKKDDDMWLCCKHHPEIGKDNEMIMEFADIEADARAKMVIFHLKNKRIKVEDL